MEFGAFCCGCTWCFMESETKCPHYEQLQPITAALDAADVIILASPVYVYHVTGSMKAFLDHYGWRWMIHRPEEKMFRKQGVCISTAAGGGMKAANRDMADSLFYWGVAKTYTIGSAVASVSWKGVSEKKKKDIERKTDQIAKQIIRRQSTVKPGLKTRGMFYLMRMLMKRGWNAVDVRYWEEKGWTQGKRPWKYEDKPF